MLKRVLVSVAILVFGIAIYQWLNSGSTRSSGRAPGPVVEQASATAQNPDNSERSGGNRSQPADGNGRAPRPENSEQANPEQTSTEQAPPSGGGRRGGGIGLRSGILAQQAATTVDAIPPRPTDQPAVLTLFGVIEPQEHTVLSATSSATVSKQILTEGSTVLTDTVILSLESSSATEQLYQRQSALNELDARVRNEALKHQNDLAALTVEEELLRIAKNSVDRFSSLNSQQLSSNNDYEAAIRSYQSQLLSLQNRQLILAQYDDAQNQLAAQRAQLVSQIRQAQQLVSELTVVAPFDGVIAKIPISRGQQVRANDVLVELYNPASLALFVRVPMRYRLDQLDLSTLAATDSYGNTWQAQSIRPINETGAQRLTFLPTNADTLTLLPGSHIELQIAYNIQQPVVAIPTTALYDQQRVYVFNQGVIEAVAVDIVGRTETGYLIASGGLPERKPIITTRLKNPISGMPVSLVRSGEGRRP